MEIKKHISNTLLNLPGWHTRRKIVSLKAMTGVVSVCRRGKQS